MEKNLVVGEVVYDKGGLEEVFSVMWALELAPLEIISKALEITWSPLEVVRADWRWFSETFKRIPRL